MKGIQTREFRGKVREISSKTEEDSNEMLPEKIREEGTTLQAEINNEWPDLIEQLKDYWKENCVRNKENNPENLPVPKW